MNEFPDTTKNDTPFAGKRPSDFIHDADLRRAARILFQRLDMLRAGEGDYEEATKLFRDIYDRGRSRGAREEVES